MHERTNQKSTCTFPNGHAISKYIGDIHEYGYIFNYRGMTIYYSIYPVIYSGKYKWGKKMLTSNLSRSVLTPQKTTFSSYSTLLAIIKGRTCSFMDICSMYIKQA